MLINLVPVPIQLQSYVECIRIIEHNSDQMSTINVYLNGLPGIVFQHLNGKSPLQKISTRLGQTKNISTLYIYGQITNPGKMTYYTGEFTTIQFVMKPDALYTLIGINASLLTNRTVDLSEFSAGDLNACLLDVASAEQCVQLLNQFMTSQLTSKRLSDDLVKESLYLISRNKNQERIGSLIDKLNVSERQFERRFKQAVGVTPKFYIRVKRFNTAIRLINSSRFDSLTDIAHYLNYYDQSHFIRDVRAFADLSPKQLSQRLDISHPEQKVFSYQTI